MKLCSVDLCSRKSKCRGYCDAHYQRLIKTGSVSPEFPITKQRCGARNSKWRGGQINDGHGRVLVYAPDHPNPSWCGSHVYRYRLIMEKHLGRYLLPSEIVHHKNGIVNDDRVENLVVTTQSKHAQAHNINGRFSARSKEI